MGKDLILELAMATNLPLEYSLKRITELVHRQGLNMDTISQEEVRTVVAHFLHEVLLSTLDENLGAQ
ncbi:MAG TPA: hypothetical protein PLJ21_02250 [Pseudobdellovibrionaceae bacterium]|nr:hypothetical protein [Pseudobdellovibrionaceae bacterium]